MECNREMTVYDWRKEKGIMPVYKMVDTCAAEFESETPYFYGTYEDENESVVTDKRKCYCAWIRSNPYRSRGRI